jgi:hypothetical protein
MAIAASSSESEYLSNSRSYVFNKCLRAYDYKYRKKIKTRSGKMGFKSWHRMFRGIAIHSAIEAGFLGQPLVAAVCAKCDKERGNGLTPEQTEALAVIEEESPIVAQSLLDWLPASDWEPMQHLGKPMVEARLEWSLPHWRGFLGFADLVARHKPSGRVMVLDWKTRETFEDEDVDRFNAQFALYQYVLAKMGIQTHGSLLVEAKPTTPKRAPKTIRDDFGGIDCVRVSADGRFRSIPTYRSPTMLQAFWDDFSVQAKVIANIRDDEIYRSMGAFACKDCDFQQLCMAELNGHDVEHVLSARYSTLAIVP